MNLAELVDDSTFFPTLQALTECLCDELARANGPRLCFCGMAPAQPPIGVMDCKNGGCGVAWVSPVSVFPSASFPNPIDPSTGNVECGTRLVMQVEIGVARCAPRAEGRANTPDAQATFDAMRLYLSDMQAARRAILCCLKGKPEFRHVQVSVESWSPIEPQGGVSGGTWTAYIG